MNLDTIHCGDCVEWLKGLPDGCADAVITDPPYNVGKDYGTHKDSMPEWDYAEWMRSVSAECIRLSTRNAWVAPRYKMDLFTSIFPKAHLVVVRRGAAGPLRGGWSDQFETILVNGPPLKVVPDLWMKIRLKGEGYFFREKTYGHPGYTPYEIMRLLVEILTPEDGLVIDPFMGTGTTAVACIRMGRRFLGCEIEPKYVDIANKRIRKARNDTALFVGCT